MGRSPTVDAWFAKLEHPLKPAMLRVREIILGTDSRMEECIKWQCPTFMYEGNLASINPRAKSHVSLLFHTGAHIPGDHPKLEGGTDTARYMKFASREEADSARRDLEAVVRAWCDWKAGALKPASGKAAKPKADAVARGTSRGKAKTKPAPPKPAASATKRR